MLDYLRFMFSDGGRLVLFIGSLAATLMAVSAWVKLVDDTNKALQTIQEKADGVAAEKLSKRREQQWEVLRSLQKAYFSDDDGLTTGDVLFPPADWVNDLLADQKATWRVEQGTDGRLAIIDLSSTPDP